jgi:hypothetical protein
MEFSGRSKKPAEKKSRTSITCCILIQIHTKNPWISRASQFLFSFVSLKKSMELEPLANNKVSEAAWKEPGSTPRQWAWG